MRQSLLGALVSCLLVAAVAVGEERSPYSGMEQRGIKALSGEAIEAYLAGAGMGFAMAAELNSYPGPKHVLELAVELGLDQEQMARTQEVFRNMQNSAVRLGQLYVDGERVLDALFADGNIDEQRLRQATEKLARIQGELRYAHLGAHLKTKQILTEDQVERYNALRGYHAVPSSEHDPQQHHDGHHP
jgi:Spy/CpxP family protein refolding chaperone